MQNNFFMYFRPFVLISLLFYTFSTQLLAAEQPEKEILNTVHGFYDWVINHGEATEALQPQIKSVPGSKRFFLDLSNFNSFSEHFIQSGFFSPDFPSVLTHYYQKQKTKIENLSKEELDQIAEDGRGPMMETEDMDIFFCAQEYEYQKDFIEGMKLKSVSIDGNHAKANVESPYQWETDFLFTKVNGKWLISGYCVFQ